jgi:hypothetical protein
VGTYWQRDDRAQIEDILRYKLMVDITAQFEEKASEQRT